MHSRSSSMHRRCTAGAAASPEAHKVLCRTLQTFIAWQNSISSRCRHPCCSRELQSLMLGSLQPKSTQPQAMGPKAAQVVPTHVDSSSRQTEASLAAATGPEKAAVQVSQPNDKRRRAATGQQTKKTCWRAGERKLPSEMTQQVLK